MGLQCLTRVRVGHRPGRAAVLVHYNALNHQEQQQLATEQAVDAIDTAAASLIFINFH